MILFFIEGVAEVSVKAIDEVLTTLTFDTAMEAEPDSSGESSSPVSKPRKMIKRLLPDWFNIREYYNSNSSWTMRKHAIERMRRKKKNFKHFMKALSDDNFDVRNTAIRALGELGDVRAIEPLKEYLEKPAKGFGLIDTMEALNKLGYRSEHMDILEHLQEAIDEGGPYYKKTEVSASLSKAIQWKNEGFGYDVKVDPDTGYFEEITLGKNLNQPVSPAPPVASSPVTVTPFPFDENYEEAGYRYRMSA